MYGMQAEIGVEVDKQLGAKADKPMQRCELKKMTLKELLALQDLQPWHLQRDSSQQQVEKS